MNFLFIELERDASFVNSAVGLMVRKGKEELGI